MPEFTLNEIADIMQKLDNKLDMILRVIATKRIEAPLPELLTLNETAEFLNRSKSTIYGMVNRLEIPHSKKGKRLSFKRSELLDWLAQGNRKTVSQIISDTENGMISKNKK